LAQRGRALSKAACDSRSLLVNMTAFSVPYRAAPKYPASAVLTDNAGIAAWAEGFKPDPPLFGVTPLDRAEIASWHSKAEGECLMAIAEAMRNTAPAMKAPARPGPVHSPPIP